MTHHSLIALLARALLAHGCGEALSRLFDYLAPDAPPFVGIVLGLAIAVAVVELAATACQRRG